MTTASIQYPPNVIRPRQTLPPRKPLGRRQLPPCFEGTEIVSRCRPFFRRRARVARPQRVAIRVRNPCRLTRLRLRGRYDGCINPQHFK